MEKVNAWDMLQIMSSDPEMGDEFGTQRALDLAAAEVDLVYAPYERFFSQEYTRAKKLYQRLEEEFEHMQENFDLTRGAAVERITVRLMASVIIAADWHSALIHRKVIAERNATFVLLAIHAYKADHGRWPKSLAEATPGTLAEFRADPFSAGDLVYRIDQGRPVFYSVGLNGTDDRGKRSDEAWAETGDEVFWPVPKE
jgi:hypothetical protein